MAGDAGAAAYLCEINGDLDRHVGVSCPVQEQERDSLLEKLLDRTKGIKLCGNEPRSPACRATTPATLAAANHQGSSASLTAECEEPWIYPGRHGGSLFQNAAGRLQRRNAIILYPGKVCVSEFDVVAATGMRQLVDVSATGHLTPQSDAAGEGSVVRSRCACDVVHLQPPAYNSGHPGTSHPGATSARTLLPDTTISGALWKEEIDAWASGGGRCLVILGFFSSFMGRREARQPSAHQHATGLLAYTHSTMYYEYNAQDRR